VLSDAERTHPHVVCDHARRASGRFADPLKIWRAEQWSLPEPSGDVVAMPIAENLASVRRLAAEQARSCGLSRERTADVVLSVNEAATNTLMHAHEPRECRIWCEPDQLVYEITSRGGLGDPLAGRREPAPDWPSGRGLWLINQLVDLVELRADGETTTVRLHVSVEGGGGSEGVSSRAASR
jgi:anti-sigma regulatory factor (Ser/Thr protein kinase)